MNLISNGIKNLIREIHWPHLVTLNNVHSIKYIVENYSFINYDFSNSEITDASVQHLGNCHTLSLSGCDKITDESVQHLGKCHTLYLICCNKITDAMRISLDKLVKKLIY